MTDRRTQIESWLSRLPGLPAQHLRLELAAGDASFRCYWRLYLPDGATRIVMDAPPQHERLQPFIEVAARLAAAGLQVPRVLAAEHTAGFLLLSDLGNRSYLEALNAACADALYDDAIEALLLMQRRIRTHGLPEFDAAEIRRELALFHDWLLHAYLDLRPVATRAELWRQAGELLVDSAAAQPLVFVHRDYHSRNLLLGPPGHNPGILDFQDAVRGPITYDLVSLLKDCYICWPGQRVQGWALDYLARARECGLAAGLDTEEFCLRFDLMGAQRHLKAAGIFCRLWLRDGKPAYLAALPRTVGYLAELGERRPELRTFAAWMAEEILPALERRTPCAP